MISLQVRLTLIIIPVFLFLWLVASYFSITQLKNDINKAMDNRLLSTATMVNNLLLSNPQSNARFGLEAAHLANDVGTTKGLACKISSLSGEIIANSHPSELDIPSRLNSGFHSLTINDLAWRVYSLKTAQHTITIAEKSSERASIFVQIVLANAIPSLLAIAASLILIWFAVGKALRPLSSLSEIVTKRNINDLRPIEIKHELRELVPLVESQNTLFKKIGEAIEREKSFTENAAHELRTPLTGIISQLQVARVTDGQTQINALQQSEISATRLKNLIENLLLLARIENQESSLNNGSWNIQRELENTTAELSYPAKNINVRLETPTLISHMPAFAFNIIVKNLLENALQYGKERESVALNICDSKDTFSIRVTNKGALSEYTLHKMNQRFWRGSSEPGTGLGLAIVNALVDELGGSISFQNISNNMFSVNIHIPIVHGKSDTRN